MTMVNQLLKQIRVGGFSQVYDTSPDTATDHNKKEGRRL